MIAHAFLAHFDDPFCEALASRHGLSVARKWTARFLESIPSRVKCRSQNCDRLWIKGAVLLKERYNRHRPSPSWRHLAGKDERHRQADLSPTLQRRAARHCAPVQEALSVR
jgi:hypothetical protein